MKHESGRIFSTATLMGDRDPEPRPTELPDPALACTDLPCTTADFQSKFQAIKEQLTAKDREAFIHLTSMTVRATRCYLFPFDQWLRATFFTYRTDLTSPRLSSVLSFQSRETMLSIIINGACSPLTVQGASD